MNERTGISRFSFQGIIIKDLLYMLENLDSEDYLNVPKLLLCFLFLYFWAHLKNRNKIFIIVTQLFIEILLIKVKYLKIHDK